MSSSRRRFARYSFALAILALSIFVRWLLIPVIGAGTLYVVFFPAMAIVAVTCGVRPGLFACALGIVLIEALNAAPAGHISLTVSFAVRSLIVLLSILYVGLVGDQLRAARAASQAEAQAARAAEQALAAANERLETAVRERTEELQRTNVALKEEIAVRQAAEERAVAERQRLDEVLETLPVYVILLTPDYHVPFANRFFRERFGEAKGRRCYEYLFQRHEPCPVCETFTALRTNQPHHWEWTGPDGRIYDIHDFPFTDTDGSRLVMEMGIDITAIKLAQTALREANERLEARVAERTAKLVEANAAKDELLGIAAHDLRNPLFIVSGFCEMLLKNKKAMNHQTMVPFLTQMNKQTQYMARLVDDLLDFSVVESGTLRLQPVPTDPVKLLTQVIDLQRAVAAGKRIDLKFRAAAGLPQIELDPNKFEQVLINLLSNAIKFSRPNSTIDVELMRADDRLICAIRDQGLGIPRQQLDEIFKPFVKAHHKGTAGEAGVGLGLAIVKKIVVAHRGELAVESEEGRGSTFTLRLPLPPSSLQ